ncbi:unnamed protein product [Staurois parvus]|uniref:Uncharacterized protein n=1 Tax=Staurois parvus TaxID=386267 RepID=A0ABN9HK58_9NEOB|nr:unnamed protein product [Staurois parvus]
MCSPPVCVLVWGLVNVLCHVLHPIVLCLGGMGRGDDVFPVPGCVSPPSVYILCFVLK